MNQTIVLTKNGSAWATYINALDELAADMSVIFPDADCVETYSLDGQTLNITRQWNSDSDYNNFKADVTDLEVTGNSELTLAGWTISES